MQALTAEIDKNVPLPHDSNIDVPATQAGMPRAFDARNSG